MTCIVQGCPQLQWLVLQDCSMLTDNSARAIAKHAQNLLAMDIILVLKIKLRRVCLIHSSCTSLSASHTIVPNSTDQCGASLGVRAVYAAKDMAAMAHTGGQGKSVSEKGRKSYCLGPTVVRWP